MRALPTVVRSRRLLLSGAGGLLLLLGGSAVALAAGVVDQQVTSFDDGGCFHDTAYAQTFTASVDGNLDRVDIGLDAFVADFSVEIRSVDGSGAPGTSALGSTTLSASANASGLLGADFATPIAVSAGTKYAIVLPQCGFSTFLYNAAGSRSDAYAGGAMFTSFDGGAWTETDFIRGTGARDLSFRTYVQPATTTTITSVVHSPTELGEAVNISASVTPTGAGANSDSPIGDILVERGSQSCHISAPSGSCTITPTSLGTRLIKATYTHIADSNGNGEFQDSVASPVSLQTTKASATVSLHVSPHPSAYRQLVHIEADVTTEATGVGTPTGSVDIYVNGGLVCFGLPSDAASCDLLDGLNVGINHLTARYGGDSNFKPSTSAVLRHVVSPAGTTTTLSVSPASVPRGQTVQLTATVKTTVPTFRSGPYAVFGRVQFMVDGQKVGNQVDLVGGQATLSLKAGLTRGSHHVRAFFVRSPIYVASSSPGMLLYVH